MNTKYFAYTVIVVVAVAIVGGFFVVGSPQNERLRRFDDKRVQDLQSLQSYIVEYWRNKNKLPDNLAALNDDLRGIKTPKDPQVGGDYEYQVKGPLTFALCADFVTESQAEDSLRPSYAYEPYFPGATWQHGKGKQCFERTIDKDFFPQTKPGPALQ